MSSSDTSSITANSIGYDSDDDGEPHQVPPPPPHIELLNLGSRDRCHRRFCVNHVISYLDDGSRKSAAVSCHYLKDAVNEWYALLLKEKDKANERKDQEPLAMQQSKSSLVALVQEDAPTASGHRTKEQRQNEDAEQQQQELGRAEEDAERRLQQARFAAAEAAAKRQELETRLERERRERELTFDEKWRAEKEARQKLAAEVAARQAELISIEEKEQLECPRLHEQMETSVEEVRANQKAIDEGAAAAELVTNQKRLEEERLQHGRLVEQARLEREQGVSSKKRVIAEPENVAVKERSILDEMDDLEKDIPKRPSLVAITPSTSSDEEKVQFTPEQDIYEDSTAEPSMSTISLDEEEKMDKVEEQEKQELESLSTIDIKAQSDMFLARVSSSGVRTPISFQMTNSSSFADTAVSSLISEEEKVHDSEKDEKDDHDGLDQDELSVLPTISNSGTMEMMTPGPGTPITPCFSTPSPKSLTGATRLELGSTSHLGDGSQLHIFGHVQSKPESKDDDNNSDDYEALSPERGMGGEHVESKPPLLPQDSKFIRLRDIRDTASEEIPFDEIPFIRKSVGSVSSYRTASNSSQSIDKSISSDESDVSPSIVTMAMLPWQPEEDDDSDEFSYGEETTSDVLSQFSDAVFFNETPPILNDIMNEITDSIKDAASHLNFAKGQQNGIDDAGPIKIGEKYYTHNEALRLWRKAKVKLEDRHHAVDKNGNVKMERATFFEKNSVFQEKPRKKVTIVEEPTQMNGDDELGAVTMNELMTRYNLFDNRSRSVDTESTPMVGNGLKIKEEREELRKLSSLPSVDETKEEDPSDSEAAPVDTESETRSSDGEDFDMDTFISGETFSTSAASHAESESSDKDSGVKSDASNLKQSIQLKRARAGNQEESSSGTGKNNAISGKDIETDSVQNSIPSHMGSAYGIEVTSLRGRSCNFINGKSSERVNMGGENGEQSVLGSQYGTEVLFKPQKVTNARKPRTLASHNMGVKSAKQVGKGTAKQVTLGNRGATVKQNNVNKSSSVSKQRTAATPLPNKSPSRKPTPTRMKLQKKLKLGIKKSAKSP